MVVNREAWRDLVPLFATIRESMPAAGIWVCTERIAIEIYAGESGEAYLRSPADTSDHPPASIPDADSSSPPSDPFDPDGIGEGEELVLDPTELTESELRDLLELWDEFDPENDPMEGPEQP